MDFLEFGIIPDLQMAGIEKDIQKSAKTIGDKLKGLDKPLETVKNKFKKSFDKKPLENFQAGLGSLKAFALKMGVAIGGALLVKKGLGIASAFEQEQGKLDFAMGNMKDDMRKFIKDLNDKSGLGEIALTVMLSSSALKMKGLGFEGKNLMKNLENISNMSLDISGNWNISKEQASDLINQAMTGQTKGLQQYGIKMDENDVKEYAKQLGRAYETLTDTEKTQMRLNILTKKAKENGVKGGFDDAKGSYEWLLERLKGQGQDTMKNMFTPIMQGLVPALESVLELIKDNQDIFKDLGKIIGVAVGGAVKLFVKLVDLSKPLIKATANIIGNFSKMTDSMDFSFLTETFGFMRKIFDLIITKVVKVGETLKTNSSGFEGAFEVMKDVIKSLMPFIEAVVDLLGEVAVIVIKVSNAMYEYLKPAFDVIGKYIMWQIEMWMKAIKGVTGFLKNVNEKGFLGAVKNVFTKEEKTEIDVTPVNREPTVNPNAPIFNETRNKTEFKPTNNINLNIDNNIGDLGERVKGAVSKELEDYNKEQERRLGIV